MRVDAKANGSVAAGRTTDLKSLELLSRDLAMLATAARYNLDDRSHRARSNADLVRLFFDLAGLAGIDLFVEAGAKEAGASRRARRRFSSARVVAFEANPYTYERFAGGNTEIEYAHLALSDSVGPVTFHVHRDERGAPNPDGQASLLKRDAAPTDRERGFEEVTVDGTTLDTFFADGQCETAAMWIDVEGACGLVLPGARELLAKTAVLIVEVEDREYWGTHQWLREQVVSYLYDFGLVPVARDFQSTHQYNIVLVRAALLDGPSRLRASLARFTSQAFAQSGD
ncbi:MAG: FkbM family methyltransferase [Actinomycetota bacterium]|nr:FkbM family methyltransferase [Actinomycetota bacterium]